MYISPQHHRYRTIVSSLQDHSKLSTETKFDLPFLPSEMMSSRPLQAMVTPPRDLLKAITESMGCDGSGADDNCKEKYENGGFIKYNFKMDNFYWFKFS